MSASLLQFLTLLVSATTALLALAAFVRAGRWRDTEEGRQVKEDIHSIKNEMGKIDARLAQAEKVDLGVPELRDRLTAVETTLESVATVGDVRELKADMSGMNRSLNNVEAATRRIEAWLVEKGR